MSRAQLLADFFKRRPLVWIDGRELEIAGRYAWRSRVSDLRRAPYFMDLENRQRRIESTDGTAIVVSEYRFVPQKLPQVAGRGQLLDLSL